jgi:hypothetical protein
LPAAATAAETAPQPRWWKGNLHTHSLWSDGNDFPEMIAAWYESRGYHFLALSDHNVMLEGERWLKLSEIVRRGGTDALEKYRQRFGDAWVETRGEFGDESFQVRLRPLDEFRGQLESPGKFLMIPGEEITDNVRGLPVHMNATNLTQLIEPMGGNTVTEAMQANLRMVQLQARALQREILVHLNHPNFGGAVTAEDLAEVVDERFMEVYNGHPGVMHLGDENLPGVERLWDIANTLRISQALAPPLYGLGTDDSHHYHGSPGSHPGRGWIMVRAERLESETLIRAIRSGDFYASSGVTLSDVRYDPDSGQLRVTIQAQDDATYTTQFIGTQQQFDLQSQPRVNAQGEPIRGTRIYSPEIGKVLQTVTGREATYQVTGNELYVRAVVTSSDPHPDPSFEGQQQQAWTQPVAWQHRLPRKTPK